MSQHHGSTGPDDTEDVSGATDHDAADHDGTDHDGMARGATGRGAHHGGHGGGGWSSVSWGTAMQATLHCLTGCAIGEVLGMVISTVANLNNTLSVILSIVLAFIFGYSLTMRSVLRAGVGFQQALRVALASDTVSILVMEIIDNTVEVSIPGAMNAGLNTVLFWGSLAFSLALAFVITTPVNRWLIGRGQGHAVMHAYH